jgi:peptidoglycan/xylan/chitin deacetylase (PgdA/CDA1 family)
LRTLADEGNEIGSHGYTHRSLVRLKPDQLKDELEKSKKELSPYRARIFSYPFGHFDSRSIEEVARYYDSARTYGTDVVANGVAHLNKYALKSFPVEGRFQTRIKPGARDFVFSQDNLQSNDWFIITLHGQISVNSLRLASLLRRPRLTKEQLQSDFRYLRARLLIRQREGFLRNFEQFCSFLADNEDTILVATVSEALERF